jgi:four helix bundle protein
MHRYKELKIWQKSIALTKRVYELTSTFPNDERFGLTSQMRRSSVSIASNIAEGAGRNRDGEFVYFLGIANGSSFELSTQLVVSKELGIVTDKEVEPLLNELEDIQKMTFKMIDVYQKKTNSTLK